MSYNAATLFDEASPNGDEYLLLDDIVTRLRTQVPRVPTR